MSRDFSETYYRKRFRKPIQQSNNYEMEYMKKKDHVAFGDSSASAKHNDIVVPPMSSIVLSAPEVNITAGSIYEIAHVHLPTRTPVNLRTVRVAMVSEKTDVTVAIKYPSMESLRKYFTINTGVDAYPELDENFVLGIGLAARVLLRKVPFQECVEKKQFHEFWLLGSDASKKGYCGLFDKLSGNGMLRWGTRRRVRFLDKHTEPSNTNTNTNTNATTDHSASSFEVARVELVEKEGESMEEGDEEEGEEHNEKEEEEEEENEENEGVKEEEEEVQDDGENEAIKEEEMEDESDEEDEEVKMEDTKKLGVKRKRYNFRASVRKPKKVKREKQPQKQQKKAPARKQNRCRQLIVLKNPKDRWSSERYKSAEKSLWEVMKAKGAVANNPILRPALRVEARKKIGDTGLLDHLLKHMAGKVAPCGKDRFRRRHNAEGQMEYWLESANLFDIRKQAGVIDPYWIPPPGWELGDSVTQDPIFAKELKILKEEILEVKRYAKKKQLELEQEVKKLRSEIKELKPKKKKGESQAIVVCSNPSGDQELSQLAISSPCANLDLNKAPEQERNKEQQINISDFVKELQEKLSKLESEVEERSRWSNSALMVPSDSFYLKEKKQAGEVEQQHTRGKEVQRAAAVEGSEVKTVNHQGVKAKTPEAEKAKTALAAGEGSEKAARIEKLRSGFRICKPQGTFLWPNMMAPASSSPSQVLLQMEDLLLVPTPPSISLTPPRMPYQQHHASPQLVKPLAERHRGFTVTASTVSESTTYEDTCTTDTTVTTTVRPTHFMGSANDEEEIELLK